MKTKQIKGQCDILLYWQDEGTNKAKIILKDNCTWKEESEGLLKPIYHNGSFLNLTSLSQIRETLKSWK